MDDNLSSLIEPVRLTTTVQDLVRIPSVNPPGDEKKVAEHLFNLLNHEGLQVKRIERPFPERPQILAVLPGKGERPPLFLNGHMDVVPEGDPSKWDVAPFSGSLKDNRIYGRGSCDMKGGIGVALEVARVLLESGRELKGDLVLTFAVGEETGEPGTKTLLDTSNYTDGFGIVLEPTGFKLGVAEKGLAWFRITLAGKPAHCSISELGINPIDKFLALGRAIKSYDGEIRRRVHPLCGPAKCTMTVLRAGTKENVVPESLSLILDRRMNPGEDAEAVEREIKEILEGLATDDPDFSYQLERTRLYESAEVSPNLSQVELLEREIEAITGQPAEIWGTPYSTDVRNFINDAGIPAVTFGPGDISQAHAFNEFIKVEDLVKATQVILGVAEKLLLG